MKYYQCFKIFLKFVFFWNNFKLKKIKLLCTRECSWSKFQIFPILNSCRETSRNKKEMINNHFENNLRV